MAAGFKQNFWIGKRANNQINQETRKMRSGKIVSSRALGHPSAISSTDKYLRYYCFILILLFPMFLDPLKFALFLSAPNTPARPEQAMIGACDLVDFFLMPTLRLLPLVFTNSSSKSELPQ